MDIKSESSQLETTRAALVGVFWCRLNAKISGEIRQKVQALAPSPSPSAPHPNKHYLLLAMASDEIVWQVINQQFCSYKLKSVVWPKHVNPAR